MSIFTPSIIRAHIEFERLYWLREAALLEQIRRNRREWVYAQVLKRERRRKAKK